MPQRGDNLETPYWGPAQIKLFIDSVWIDDACAIQYRIRDEKTPKFGYFDDRYRAVAHGPTLVQGQLSIEFRYVGYLNSVIARHVRRRKEIDILADSGVNYAWKQRLGEIDHHVLQNEPAVVLELLSEAANSANKDMRDKLFNKMKDKFWSGQEEYNKRIQGLLEKLGQTDDSGIGDYSEGEIAAAYRRAGQIPHGFDIKMIFGTDHAKSVDPGLVKIITDCRIVGESQVVEIGVPDGSRSVREVYNFFAKDITPGIPLNMAPANKKKASRYARSSEFSFEE